MSNIPKWEDTTEVTPAKSDIKQDATAGLAGFGQGASFGFSDELAGLLGAGYSGAKNLGNLLTGKEQDPATLLEQYKAYRDLVRQKNRELEKESPNAFLTGELAGGLVTPLPVIGEAKAAKTALSAADRLKNLGKIIGTGATVGAGVGAVAGAGVSEKTGEELLGDVAESAKSGALIGGIAPVAIKAITATPGAVKTAAGEVGRIISNDLDREAYRLGKQGIDISSPEFAKAHRAELTAESEKLAKAVEPIKTEAQKEIDKIQSTYAKQLDDYNKTLEDYNTLQEKFKAGQVSANDKILKTTNNEVVNKAKDLQQNLKSIKDKLGDEYENIYAKTKDVGVEVDLDPVINEFMNSLESTDLTDDAIKRIGKQLDQHRGVVDFKEFQDFKQKLNDIMNSGSYRASGLAKKAYGASARAYEQTLRKMGQDALADNLAYTNKQWTTYSNMDDYVNAITPDKITGKVYAAPETVSTIESLAQENPKKLADMEKFRDYSEQLGLDVSEQERISEQLKKAKEFKPTELEMPEVVKPELDAEALVASKQRLSQLQSYLGKGDKQSIDKARELIVEASKLFGNPKREEELNIVKDILDKAYGKEASDQIFQKMKTLSERERIGRITHKEVESPLTKPGALRAEFGGARELKMRGANILGRTEKAIPEMSKRLYDKSPESLKVLADTIGAVAKPGYEALSTALKQVAGSDKTAKQALIYSIMQNPGYRQALQENDIDLQVSEQEQ